MRRAKSGRSSMPAARTTTKPFMTSVIEVGGPVMAAVTPVTPVPMALWRKAAFLEKIFQ